MRFLLGVAESGVFPATLVLLANWFPRSERARANAYWNLCQPLAVAGSAPFTGWLLGAYGWQPMLILEGLLPFIWLPIWWFCIRDHPREAKWISAAEKDYLETTLRTRSRRTGTIAEDFLVRKTPASVDFRHDCDLFFAQLRGLRLHDFFHERTERPGFQRVAVRYSVCRALCRDGGRDDAQLLAFGQNPRAARTRRRGLFHERNEPDFERVC